jgi:hypothetical protein
MSLTSVVELTYILDIFLRLVLVKEANCSEAGPTFVVRQKYATSPSDRSDSLSRERKYLMDPTE